MKRSLKAKALTKQKDFSKSYVDILKKIAIFALVAWLGSLVFFEIRKRLAAAPVEPIKASASASLYKDNKWSAVPNVKQYEQTARLHGWIPANPVERLVATISKYPQVFDILSSEGKEDPLPYITMLDDETRFLLQILVKSDDTQFDLTSTLHTAIAIVHQLKFRIMKHRLLIGHPRVVNRDIVDVWTRQWVLNPVKALLTLPLDKHPHITIDFEAGQGNSFTPLMKAVQYRLYGLFVALAMRSSSPRLGDALSIAVSNGDDLAVGILLKTQADYHLPTPTPPDLLNSYAIAQGQRYEHLAARIGQSICAVQGTAEGLDCSAPSAAALPLFNEFMAINDTCMDTCVQDSVGAECAVESVYLEDLDMDHFLVHHVQRNQPLLIKLYDKQDTSRTYHNPAAKAFAKDELKRKYAGTRVVVGPIPYSSLFGKLEKLWTLSHYFEYADNHTAQIRSQLADGTLDALQTDFSLLTTLHDSKTALPLYLFSDDQQEITKLLQADAMAVLQHAHPSSVKLISLLHAIASTEQLQTVVQLFIGPVLSGAPMHSHGPAVNVLLSGTKLWSITPPAREMYTNIHPWEWIAKDMTHSSENPFYSNLTAVDRKAEPCRLVQRAGEALFAPRHWTHQVLNLEEAIGFAVEVKNYVY